LLVWVLSILSARTMATSPARFASAGTDTRFARAKRSEILGSFASLTPQDDT